MLDCRWWLVVGMVLLMGCGGSGSSDPTSAPNATDNNEQILLKYQQSELTSHLALIYSQQENYQGGQYSSALNIEAERSRDTLNLTLDLYLPPNSEPRPLIIFIHGGNFYSGSKETLQATAQQYAQLGFATATINYRLTSQALQVLAFEYQRLAIDHATEDLINAIRFLKYHSGRYAIDTNRVMLMGKSAGGVMALIAALEADTWPENPEFFGVSASVAAVISTGAALEEWQRQNLTSDSADAPVLMFFNKSQDPLTGLSWQQHALPTQRFILSSGNICELIGNDETVHTIDFTYGSNYFIDIYQFLLRD